MARMTEAAPPANLKRTLLRTAKWIVAVVVVGFVVYAIARDLRSVDDWSAFKPDFRFLALALLAQLGVSSVQMISYRHLLRQYGASPTLKQMAAIAWLPPLGKYLPGKVWAIGGAIVMLRKFGIGAAVAVGVVLTLDAFAVVTGLVVGSPVLTREPASNIIPGGMWIALAVAVVGVVALSPPVLSRSVNLLLRTLNKPTLEKFPSFRGYALPLACAVAQWIFAGTVLWCVGNAFATLPAANWIDCVFIQACAMTVGYLVLIAPAGIGPTDGIRLLMLSGLLVAAPDGTAAVIVIATRLIQTFCEVELAGVGFVMLRRSPELSPN